MKLSRSGEETIYTDEPPTIGSDVSIVVLINEGSASASEIVAATLQEANRAVLVGKNSFGKGTVQEIVEFHTDGSGIKVTSHEWVTPGGRKIDQLGVAPDFEVEYESERDEQLLKALDLLR